MRKESTYVAVVPNLSCRITRARSKALGTSSGVLPVPKPSLKDNEKQVQRASKKTTAQDENSVSVAPTASFQHKRRAVLKDVTNVSSENSYVKCISATKSQISKRPKRCATKRDPDLDANVSMVKACMIIPSAELERDQVNVYCSTRESGILSSVSSGGVYSTNDGFHGMQTKEENNICDKLELSSGLFVVNIDSNLQDPQVCCLYAPDIYNGIHTKELDQRPSTTYMESLQCDISSSMRGILVDWLVEVSDEYRLVADTLYLTVNLIDRFLSQNYIEKQRLQLLGVTCMLIASKYEEICAPRVEEFCFITDNTYTKGEVLKMESEVLNFLNFNLSVPTTKTFLRRFVLAAQASCKVPHAEMEYLANYLAELSLVEYDFLKFLPSLVAASAVFLAGWTLNQSDHPWNPTMVHYTCYKAAELKASVVALEDLQLNSNGCFLNAVRSKYRQQKFKSVANLASSQRVLSLF